MSRTTTGVNMPANYAYTRGDVDPNLDLPDELAEAIVTRLNDLLQKRLEERGIHWSRGSNTAVRYLDDDRFDPHEGVPRQDELIPDAENLSIQRELAEEHGVEGVA